MQTSLIGLGGNLGNTTRTLSQAVFKLSRLPSTKLLDTSFLHRTEPAYLLQQPPFFNTVCSISTGLRPQQLLESLKDIERTLGRVESVRNGPRAVDLDILTYGDDLHHSPDLTIPHPRIAERDFVLAPLCDLAPHARHPVLGKTFAELWAEAAVQRKWRPPPRVMCLDSNTKHRRVIQWSSRTLIMGILNCTPDSFSDGGKFASADAAVQHAQQMIDAGADILDIGGESTRPNATPVSEAEELERVIPVIRGIRARSDIPISIDTYRSEVAKQAVSAGANMVNDVSGGVFDDKMLPTIAELAVPCVLMHLRGNPQTMLKPENLSYSDLFGEISSYLAQRVQAALNAGIPRFNIIVDPGIGFAKTLDHNLSLVTGLSRACPARMPILAGPSRKGFLGRVLERRLTAAASSSADSKRDRVWGTAAAVTASVQSGADIVRVHDVREQAAVAAVADAMFRGDRDRVHLARDALGPQPLVSKL